MKKRSLINIGVCIIIILSGCKKENATYNPIVGNWELNSHSVFSNGVLAYNYDYVSGKSFIYKLNENNTYTLSSVDSLLESGSYELYNDTLYHHYMGIGIERFGYQHYSISANKLTLSDSGNDSSGDFTEFFIYTRVHKIF